MKIIVEAEPEDIESAIRCVLGARPTFARSGGKVGWGWTFGADNGKSYFVRELKDGLSARPARKS